MRRRSHNREVTLNPREYGRANDAVRKPGKRDPGIDQDELREWREYERFARNWDNRARRRRQASISRRHQPTGRKANR